MVQKMRLLVVDDQVRARQSLMALLGAWYPTAQVGEAADGYEAVLLAEQLQPDIILMDARMPKMSGLEAARQIKAKSALIKIVVLSIYVDLQEEALAAGADAFVGKSDPPEKLRETLKDIFNALEQKE